MFYIPGFRKKKITNMIIACIYYISAFRFFYQDDISVGIAALSLPLMFFSSLDLIKKKQKFFLIPLAISLIMFFIAIITFPEEDLMFID